MRLVVHLRRCGPARGRASRAPPERGRASRRRGHIPESGGGGEARDLSGVVPRVAGMLSRAAPSENSAFRFHALAVPQRGTRAKQARPPTGSSQPRRSISTAPAASDGPSTPKPRASARSRRHFGGAPQGPGGALSAAAGPRRVDVPVRAEDFELPAAVVRTPGAEPEPYGAQRKPWGPPAPRRAFRVHHGIISFESTGLAQTGHAPQANRTPEVDKVRGLSETGEPREPPWNCPLIAPDLSWPLGLVVGTAVIRLGIGISFGPGPHSACRS